MNRRICNISAALIVVAEASSSLHEFHECTSTQAFDDGRIDPKIAMDIETAEAVETLRSDIHRVEREVVRVETSLTARIEHVETSLIAKMDEHKSHNDLRLESMHDDIRMLAEHVVALSSKVDSLRR